MTMVTVLHGLALLVGGEDETDGYFYSDATSGLRQF